MLFDHYPRAVRRVLFGILYTTNSIPQSYPRKFTTLSRTPSLFRVFIEQSPIMPRAGDTHAYSRHRNTTESTSDSRNGNNSSTHMPQGHRLSGRKRPLDSDGEDDTRGKRGQQHTKDRQKEKITVMNNISEPRFEECYNVWNRGTLWFLFGANV